MNKLLKFINIILISTLIITVNANIKNEKISLKHEHHYKCTYNIYNDALGANYNYYFDLYTDEYYTLTSKKYTEEFTYNDEYYYLKSKDFYSNSNLDFNVSFDDNNRKIELKKEMKIDPKEENQYEKFIQNNISSNFVCEEIL